MAPDSPGKSLDALPNSELLASIDEVLVEVERRLLHYARTGPELLEMADEGLVWPRATAARLRQAQSAAAHTAGHLQIVGVGHWQPRTNQPRLERRPARDAGLPARVGRRRPLASLQRGSQREAFSRGRSLGPPEQAFGGVQGVRRVLRRSRAPACLSSIGRDVVAVLVLVQAQLGSPAVGQAQIADPASRTCPWPAPP